MVERRPIWSLPIFAVRAARRAGSITHAKTLTGIAGSRMNILIWLIGQDEYRRHVRANEVGFPVSSLVSAVAAIMAANSFK